MEVLTSKKRKRTILLMKEKNQDTSQLCDMFAEDYHFRIVTALEEAVRILREDIDKLSAVLIDACLPDDVCGKFLQRVREYKNLHGIPVLVIVPESEISHYLHYLEFGAVDFITSPYCREVIINRISNAVHIKDSVTFSQLEKMLRELPSNIYLKDAEGKYIFATHYWHHLEHNNDPDWTIRGKTDIDIRKDKENAVRAYLSDLELLKDGEIRSYMIEINADNILEYFQITKAPVLDEKDDIIGIIALINNITQQEVLKRKLEKQAYTDEMTGLYNRSYYEKYISALMENHYPLAVISADCNKLKSVNDTYGHLAGDEYIRISASLLKMVLPEESVIFRTGGDEFLIFLPETSEETALYYVERLREQSKLFSIKDQQISISYGVYVMEDENQDLKDCIRQADKNMYEDKKRCKKES